MTQMIKLFAAASTQPSQHLLPTRMVEKIVRTQDKQSSRNTSESISSFISFILPRIDLQVCVSKLRWRNLRNRTPSVFVVSGTPTARTRTSAGRVLKPSEADRAGLLAPPFHPQL